MKDNNDNPIRPDINESDVSLMIEGAASNSWATGLGNEYFFNHQSVEQNQSVAVSREAWPSNVIPFPKKFQRA